ncbi:unnamed protein product [Malus baccata var. baccata]
MQQHPSSEVNANQRIARISAHLDPPNLQMENAATVNRLNCRAKGGTAGYKVAILGAAWRHRPASRHVDEDEPFGLRSPPIRRRQHPRRYLRYQPHGHRRRRARVFGAAAAGRSADRNGTGDHPGRRASKTRNDKGRFV